MSREDIWDDYAVKAEIEQLLRKEIDMAKHHGKPSKPKPNKPPR